MTTTRWATMAVAMTVACLHAVGTASCGGEPHDASGGRADGAAETGQGLADAGTGDDSTLPGNDDGGGGFLLLDSAAADAVDAACTPAMACPPGVQCGRYVDRCSGSVFVCGSPCPSGEVCTSTAASPPAQSCQPKTCVGKCGSLGVDSCGVAIGCGGCPTGQDCIGNQCIPQGSAPNDAGRSDTCAPLTCQLSPQTLLCGTIHDGCGNSAQCSCPSGQQCVSGVCAPPAPECDAGGSAKCGSVQNACGSGSVTCGSCPGASKCVAGVCTSCTPPTCGSATCGNVNNGCGSAVSCGTCNAGKVCNGGGCCTPTTCSAAMDGGPAMGCAPVDLGCGIKKSCHPCAAGEICVNDACKTCTPKTCTDFGNVGCGHSDGCGNSLNCCGSATTCQSGICCSPGEVNYNGSCCLPGCDLDLPPGTQISCGQVLVCAGSGGGSSSSGGTGTSSGMAK